MKRNRKTKKTNNTEVHPLETCSALQLILLFAGQLMLVREINKFFSYYVFEKFMGCLEFTTWDGLPPNICNKVQNIKIDTFFQSPFPPNVRSVKNNGVTLPEFWKELPVSVVCLDVRHLHFNCNSDSWPPNLQHLKSRKAMFCTTISNVIHLPRTLISATLSDVLFASKDASIELPSGLRFLAGGSFLAGESSGVNQLSLMTCLQMLSWRGRNHPILEKCPESLRVLFLGDTFNEPIPELPPFLEVLGFGTCFNHPLPKLPASLRDLGLEFRYDQPMPALPPRLKYLQTGQSQVQTLPPSLKGVVFLFLDTVPTFACNLRDVWLPNYFDASIQLPDSVRLLIVGRSFVSFATSRFPTTLKEIHVSSKRERSASAALSPSAFPTHLDHVLFRYDANCWIRMKIAKLPYVGGKETRSGRSYNSCGDLVFVSWRKPEHKYADYNSAWWKKRAGFVQT